VTSHSATLSGLQAGTLSNYRVKSRDAAGNLATSGNFTFTTAAAPPTSDTTAPIISGVAPSGITSSGATINWATNEASDTQVEYGTTTAYGASSALNTAQVTSHSVTLSGLQTATLYHYRVKSRDAAGNLATSADFTFTTAAASGGGGSSTVPNLKVAFIGDQGNNSNSIAVLNLIKNEGAQMVIHSGDFDYGDNPTAWDNNITSVLGANYPYFASVGNHDVAAWPGYQQKLQERLARVPEAICTGDLGVQSPCRFRGLFFLLSGAGTMGSGHDVFLRDQLAADNSVWSVCSWHKNQREMQIGGKGSEVGWGPYEECRIGGGIITTGHEHSYSRTKTLINMQTQTVDPAWPDPNTVRVIPGSTFAFVSGLGGSSIRDQERCLPTSYPYGCNGEWAKIYALQQGAKEGALFITFNVDGDPRKARGEFKNVNGEVVDTFTIFAGSGAPPPPPSSDTTAPSISGMGASGITASGATINWTTNEASDSQVEYGTTTPYGSVSALNGTQVTSHSVALGGLLAGTLYHYRAKSRDAAGTLVTSADFTFTTAAAPPVGDTTAPVITGVGATGITTSGVTINWTTNEASDTQVEYGTTVLYGSSSALNGTMVTSHSMTLGGTQAATLYHYRVKSRDAAGNLATSGDFTFTTLASTPPPTSGEGTWISSTEIASLSTTGSAWSNVQSAANGSCGTPDLANQDDPANVCILAKALVFARTGGASYRSDVVTALRSIVNSGTYNGRALALGRELGTYAIAADLISLKTHDATLDQQFRAKLRELLTTPTSSGPGNLVECHENRPNNWGTHCGGTRAAVAAYLGDTAELARVAQVFKGYLGDRTSYAGFSYGDLSWQCDASKPVGINPAGCTKDGNSIDGVLPDDQRRGGSFSWPPPHENYVYEALQGALMQAVILKRKGYDVFNWENKALLRAFQWLHNVANFPPEGDDRWESHLINYFYGTNFPAQVPTSPGKNMGWTDWTHP